MSFERVVVSESRGVFVRISVSVGVSLKDADIEGERLFEALSSSDSVEVPLNESVRVTSRDREADTDREAVGSLDGESVTESESDSVTDFEKESSSVLVSVSVELSDADTSLVDDWDGEAESVLLLDFDWDASCDSDTVADMDAESDGDRVIESSSLNDTVTVSDGLTVPLSLGVRDLVTDSSSDGEEVGLMESVSDSSFESCCVPVIDPRLADCVVSLLRVSDPVPVCVSLLVGEAVLVLERVTLLESETEDSLDNEVLLDSDREALGSLEGLRDALRTSLMLTVFDLDRDGRDDRLSDVVTESDEESVLVPEASRDGEIVTVGSFDSVTE